MADRRYLEQVIDGNARKIGELELDIIGFKARLEHLEIRLREFGEAEHAE